MFQCASLGHSECANVFEHSVLASKHDEAPSIVPTVVCKETVIAIQKPFGRLSATEATEMIRTFCTLGGVASLHWRSQFKERCTCSSGGALFALLPASITHFVVAYFASVIRSASNDLQRLFAFVQGPRRNLGGLRQGWYTKHNLLWFRVERSESYKDLLDVVVEEFLKVTKKKLGLCAASKVFSSIYKKVLGNRDKTDIVSET